MAVGVHTSLDTEDGCGQENLQEAKPQGRRWSPRNGYQGLAAASGNTACGPWRSIESAKLRVADDQEYSTAESLCLDRLFQPPSFHPEPTFARDLPVTVEHILVYL